MPDNVTRLPKMDPLVRALLDCLDSATQEQKERLFNCFEIAKKKPDCELAAVLVLGIVHAGYNAGLLPAKYYEDV